MAATELTILQAEQTSDVLEQFETGDDALLHAN